MPLSDSGVRWVAVEGTAERDKDGRAVSMRGVTRDITERKKAELALAERNLQLALAGKAALVGSFAYDLDTERMQISEGYAAIHGFPDGTTEIARSEWQLGVHPEDRVDGKRSEAASTASGWTNIVGNIDLFGHGASSVDRGACFRFVRRRWPPATRVGVDIDVTERKRAEDHYRAH